MAKQYKYIKKVKGPNGKWRYIYEKPDDKDWRGKVKDKTGVDLTPSKVSWGNVYDNNLDPNYAVKPLLKKHDIRKKTKQQHELTPAGTVVAAGKGVASLAKASYKYGKKGVIAARNSSEAATEKRKQKRDYKAANPTGREANEYDTSTAYDNTAKNKWRGMSSLNNRGRKKANKRGSTSLGKTYQMTDTDRLISQRKVKKTRSSAVKTPKRFKK